MRNKNILLMLNADINVDRLKFRKSGIPAKYLNEIQFIWEGFRMLRLDNIEFAIIGALAKPKNIQIWHKMSCVIIKICDKNVACHRLR